MKKKYFKCRNNEYYTKFTKKSIYNLIDYKNFDTVKPFLKEMDYPLCEKAYYRYVNYSIKNGDRPESALAKYINYMRTAGFKNFGYNTIFEF